MTSTVVMVSLLLSWGCSDLVRSSPELRDTDQVSSPVVFQRCTFCLKLSTVDWPLTRARGQLLTSSHVSSQHFQNLRSILTESFHLLVVLDNVPPSMIVYFSFSNACHLVHVSALKQPNPPRVADSVLQFT
jgi:hypothetical protein